MDALVWTQEIPIPSPSKRNPTVPPGCFDTLIHTRRNIGMLIVLPVVFILRVLSPNSPWPGLAALYSLRRLTPSPLTIVRLEVVELL